MDIPHPSKAAYQETLSGIVEESGSVAGAIVLVDADGKVTAVIGGRSLVDKSIDKALIARAMRDTSAAISTPPNAASLVEQMRPSPHAQLWDRVVAVPLN